ncbi:MAG: transporter substrate-binding domain-containing protein, partial [Clostridia bacterium]|nr:transporter substrate-binding domain-containing protein [Clostridia bacterium]
MNRRAVCSRRRGACFALSLILVALLLWPLSAHANDEEKVVRVGWYESTFNTTDAFGRRSGYGYEYQMKIASYSGWKYERVTGSWPALMEMLIDGDIDLMSDVSCTEERAGKMLYPTLPMGTEEYYLFTAPGNQSIDPSDYATLNGKRIGVNKSSVQADFYREWEKRNGVQSELIELTCSEDESLSMVARGELDGYVTVDSFVNPERAVPVCKIGASDFFFAVSTKRPDLLNDLNEALDRIQSEDRYYNQRMFEKHIKRSGANAFLTEKEVSWLAGHGPIRVGYQDNYLAFCAADRNGELTGILKDCLAYTADCVLISNYRYNNIARQCEKYRLATLTTGIDIDFRFAVSRGQTALYSIMAKTVGLVPDSAVNGALSYYIAEDARLTLTDFIVDHLGVVTVVIAVVLLVIFLLMLQNMRAVRRARRLISATENDDLTGLYNRNFFLQYADRMYREHPENPMDAIVLNIEQFHSVNALNGREFGDQVLRALGSEIRAVAIEAGGIAGRFEADRFDIYCRHPQDYQAIYDRLQGKLDALAPNASVRLRMGVMAWQAKLEPVQMFDRARTACTMARDHYNKHLIVFDELVRDREIYEQRLLNDLRRALDSYEFEVYYQPKYDIQSDPPKLVSAEALVRWRHPELGMIPP